MDNLVTNPRLLILGYGGLDRHINEWILQFMRIHGSSARIVYVGGHGNSALVNRIITHSPEASRVNNQFPYYGTNLFLDTARFPFEDNQLIEKIVHFLSI